MSRDYQQQLGDRLRAIRSQQNLTLQDVEEKSAGEWKAVVIGSYERGDRAVSVAKLAKLARFYGVPMRDLLPRVEVTADEPLDGHARIVLDLTRIAADATGDEALAGLARYARRIQLQRGDYNGRMLTLRTDDIQTLASAFGRETDDLVADLHARAAILAR